MHRALKLYLRVGQTCPTPFILGDSGWHPTQLKRKVLMLKLWNKLQMQGDERLTRRVFKMDYTMATKGKNNWCKDVKRILHETAHEQYFSVTDGYVDIVEVEKKLKDNYYQKWKQEISTMSKLDVYQDMKDEHKLEDYITAKYLSSKQRSLIARARSGTLHIEIERGRWQGKARDQRLCRQCTAGQVETMDHFILHCTAYHVERQTLIENTGRNHTVKSLLSNSSLQKHVANYIMNCFSKLRK